MKNNKTLKYTGIIQGVLIATLLLLAIWIQVTFLYNYYCEDSSFWAIHGDYPVLFIFNTLFTTFASFSSLSGNYVLYVIFGIMDIASLVLPVYLVYKSIRSKSTMANGLIIISSAVTFMIMGWVGELFWGFLRFQLLFHRFFPDVGLGFGLVLEYNHKRNQTCY